MIWVDRGLLDRLGARALPMAEVFAIRGEVFRSPRGVRRRTLRFEAGGRGYFLKLHWGVGWREIFKNLAALRWPVLGAMTEWRAIQRLDALGIATMRPAAYGREGWNPARLRSFVITEELAGCVSLEDYTKGWSRHTSPPAEKRALIRRVADIAARLHRNGVNHRDFYLCHFLMREPWDGTEQGLELYLIDLHRVQLRRQVPERWRVKDLGSLLYSALDIGLTARDRLRFVRAYSGLPLREALGAQGEFWGAVARRAQQLAARAPVIEQLERREEIALQGSGALTEAEPLRVLPGKRWSGLARWQEREVFVKVYQDPRRAVLHAEREEHGLRALAAAGLDVPALLWVGRTSTEHWPVLITERVTPAEDFSTVWRLAASEEERLAWLGRLVALLAEHHGRGIQQTDPHFGNFLISGDLLVSLDGAGIRVHESPLSPREALRNLGLLLAQLTPEHDACIPPLVARYWRARSWPGPAPSDLLLAEVQRSRATRWRELSGKLFRECTEIACEHHPYGYRIARREWLTPALEEVLANPDRTLSEPGMIKRGNTCTLWRTEADGRGLVIKRYNVKGRWHGIKLAIRPGRAVASWRNAHRLLFSGVATPEPVALVKRRARWWGPVAYFAAEDVGGVDALEWLADSERGAEEREAMILRIAALVDRLREQRIAHGDLKATNVLIRGTHPLLVDLDAVRFHRWRWAFRRAWVRDRARFLRNWEGQPELLARFAELLPETT